MSFDSKNDEVFTILNLLLELRSDHGEESLARDELLGHSDRWVELAEFVRNLFGRKVEGVVIAVLLVDVVVLEEAIGDEAALVEVGDGGFEGRLEVAAEEDWTGGGNVRKEATERHRLYTSILVVVLINYF